MNKRTALLIGATGLVGKELLQILLDAEEYRKVTILVRRPLEVQHEKLDIKVIDFEEMDANLPFSIDDVYCCIGTTIKVAKTKEQFKKVDYHYPMTLAKIMKKQGAKTFSVISTMGANVKSKIFYSRTKGELEKDLTKLHFSHLYIFRPSLLVGEREQFRLGEKIGEVALRILRPILLGPFKKYRSIHAKQVAFAMYKTVVSKREGEVVVIESDEMSEIK